MLRPFTADDRAVYVQMAHDFYRSEACDHVIPDAYLERTADSVLQGNPMAAIYLFEKDGQTAGYVLLAMTWSQEGGGLTIWVDELYLLPQFRGQGLATDMFHQLRTLYPNAARFRLEIAPENLRAKALYERMGYEMLNYQQLVLEIG